MPVPIDLGIKPHHTGIARAKSLHLWGRTFFPVAAARINTVPGHLPTGFDVEVEKPQSEDGFVAYVLSEVHYRPFMAVSICCVVVKCL